MTEDEIILEKLRRSTWLRHAKGYLEAARLCCSEIIDPKRNKLEDDPSAPENWDLPYAADQILPVVLFNTKHGIEVMLKTLLLRLNLEDFDHHDIKIYFQKLKRKLKKINWKPVPSEYISEDEIKRVFALIPSIESDIEYFANNLFVSNKLNISPIPDPKNELFRYPEMKKLKYPFPYDDFINSLVEEDIIGLKRKIAVLQRNLLDLGYMIAIEAKHFPEILQKEDTEKVVIKRSFFRQYIGPLIKIWRRLCFWLQS